MSETHMRGLMPPAGMWRRSGRALARWSIRLVMAAAPPLVSVREDGSARGGLSREFYAYPPI